MNDILEAIAQHINDTTDWVATVDKIRLKGNPGHLNLYHYRNHTDQIGLSLKNGTTLHIPTLATSLGHGTTTDTIDITDPNSLQALTKMLQNLLPEPRHGTNPPEPPTFSIEQEVIRNPLLQLTLLALLTITWPIRATIRLFH